MSWPAFWQQRGWQAKLLWPLSKLVCWEATRRLAVFNADPPIKQTQAVTIVVGNLVVGGSGKTPFIVWLVKQLQSKNLKVGIVSRGYGGKSSQWPQLVTEESDPKLVGDEPVLLAKQLQCSVAVSPVRVDAVTLLEERNQTEPFDVIISDDGLQHYGLARDIEVVLVDAQRLWGNGLCLPAGPLREPKARLNQVDYIIYNGEQNNHTVSDGSDVCVPQSWQQKSFTMTLQPVCFRQVANPKNTLPPSAFSGQSVTAMAGIGNPQRFFETLKTLSIKADEHPFKDHYVFSEEDFASFNSEKPLLMTEKDAVKCTKFASNTSTQQNAQKMMHKPKNWWYLEVAPQADKALFDRLYQQIHSRLHQY